VAPSRRPGSFSSERLGELPPDPFPADRPRRAPTEAAPVNRSARQIENPGGGDAGVSKHDDQHGGPRSSQENDIGWIVLRSILLMADLIAPL